VVDDELPILHAFTRAYRDSDVHLVTASTAAEGLQRMAEVRPDVIILDIRLPDRSGLELFQEIHAKDARIPVIFITGHGTTDTAIEAIKLGAFEYLTKPLELATLREIVGRAFEISRLMSAPAMEIDGRAELPPADGSDRLVGRSPAMQEVYKSIGRVAPQDVTVLILGDSGTGKELVARAIYQHSRRASGPFMAINCAAIPENLLESELFGHEKGSFTGADRKRIGKFEQCTGGTLFLDEIGDMTPLTQAKILRALQDQKFERIGGNETIRTDVRVIAATNRDLEKASAAGQFRSDLYYRLSVFTIRIPPLRERADDLPLLCDYYVRRFAKELGKGVETVAPEAMTTLRHYAWPGNVRELQSVLKQAILQATGPVLVPDFLPACVRAEHAGSPAQPGATADGPLGLSELTAFISQRLNAGTRDLYTEWRAVAEKHLLLQVLRFTGGNLSQTAKVLGINRATLRSKIEGLGLSIERTSTAPEDSD